MATCSCDNQVIPDWPDIPAGLDDLPRQLLGFGEFRKALIEDIASHPELAGWSAEGEQDLGVMLLEMWAYVLDVTQFYDARITEELFLRPSKRQVSAERLVKLLGYRPRPALSAAVTLAATADGTEPVTLPEGTAFRSEAFDDEPPQVFSAITAQDIRPERNAWTLKPIPSETFPGRILFAESDAGVPKTGLMAFAVTGGADHAGHIQAVDSTVAEDGQRYRQVTLEEGHAPLEGKAVKDIRPWLMGLAANPTRFGATYSGGKLVLDSLYSQVRAGQIAVLELAGTLYPFTVPAGGVGTKDVAVGSSSGGPSDGSVNPQFEVDDPMIAFSETPGGGGFEAQAFEFQDFEAETAGDVTVPVTTVTLPAIDGLTLSGSSDYRLHIGPIAVGRLVAPAKIEITLDDILGGAALERPQRTDLSMLPGGFLLTGAAPEGTALTGQVETDPVTRAVSLVTGSGNTAFPAPLLPPLALRGNLVEAVRGEIVRGEVLGSGNAGSPVNRFKFKKKPLSWIEDGSATDGIRPLAEVRVDGVRWDRVDTLYTAGPDDRVYMLERDEDGETWAVFGDGTRGTPPTTGTGNITATYYYGAGAAKPPPGTIRRIARPVRNLGSVLNPLPARGGKHAESREDLKQNAPSGALTLGRAVSVQDFAALAGSYAGILNVAAGWAWDPRRQTALVSIWYIGDGGVDAGALEDWLAAQAAPDIGIAVKPATPVPLNTDLSLLIDDAYPADDTRAAVLSNLSDPDTGLLAPRNVAIGQPVYRSPIVKAAQTVPGVSAVTSLRVNGAALDWAIRIEAGHYPDFSDIEVS